MQFVDLELSRRLESAEGHAASQYAATRQRLFPESGAEWLHSSGAFVVFDGIESPVTQTFGLGIFEEIRAEGLDEIEKFFHDRRAPVFHEVSPFAGVNSLDLLCRRHYSPIEISSVLYQQVVMPKAQPRGNINVRTVGTDEVQLWTDIGARGWSHEHPELKEFLLEAGTISSARIDSPCFLAEVDGKPGAAGLLFIHDGVALFGGAATVPELRRRGLQTALLHERMRFAADHGCDLAMMVAEVGSNSQRNAERKGFRIAYTRTKWKLRSGEV